MSSMTLWRSGMICSLAILAGCAPGLMGGDTRDPALDRILVSDSDVPAKQGLMFSAMQDAEVARQSASFALVAEHLDDAKMQLNNVLHAIDPEVPGTPTITASGLTVFWPRTRYGLRRSVQDMDDEMRSFTSRHDDREAIAAQAGQVTACTGQTLSRVDRLASLSQQGLSAASRDELTPLLAEIDNVARIILEAPAADAADACSLEDTRQDLLTLAQQLA
jgi:prophage DNA circulation protein